MNETVSIAMTTYNGERFLRQQLESLYGQTRKPDEVIAIDDGSTDDTINILEEYHKKYGLQYFVNAKHLGVNKNFEKAIRACHGDYIAISDQDDVWFPEKIEVTLNKMKDIEAKEPTVVSSQSIGVDAEMNIISRPSNVVDTDDFITTFLTVGTSQGCTLMMNRKLISLLKDFPINIYYDAYIAYVAAGCGKKYNLAKPLMYYRHHDKNVLGRINQEDPYFERKIKRLSYYKYDYPVKRGFINVMEVVRDKHYDDLKENVITLCNKYIDYRDVSSIIKPFKIMQLTELPLNKRIKGFCILLLLALMPIKDFSKKQ